MQEHHHNSKVLLEVCCSNIESVMAASTAGAHRIELCSALETGGVTPSIGFIEKAVEIFKGDMMVLIRPRSGDYIYSSLEIDLMVRDIQAAIEKGATGVVVGALLNDDEIDVEACKIFIQAAEGHQIVFHRAFDRVKDPMRSIDTLVELGFDRILTSGCYPNVNEGLDSLMALNKYADNRITIMPGGGVTPLNAAEIIARTGCHEIHASAKQRKSNIADQSIQSDIATAYDVTSPEIVKELISVLL